MSKLGGSLVMGMVGTTKITGTPKRCDTPTARWLGERLSYGRIFCIHKAIAQGKHFEVWKAYAYNSPREHKQYPAVWALVECIDHECHVREFVIPTHGSPVWRQHLITRAEAAVAQTKPRTIVMEAHGLFEEILEREHVYNLHEHIKTRVIAWMANARATKWD